MIADITNELSRIVRDLHRSFFLFPGEEMHRSHSVTLPPDLILAALRIEVNEYAYLEALYRDRLVTNSNEAIPLEIRGVRVYPISGRFEQLPAPGWRIINPFQRK